MGRYYLIYFKINASYPLTKGNTYGILTYESEVIKMKKLFTKLLKYKVAFEVLAEAKLVNLDDEPSYWRVLAIIDRLYRRRYVL